jgi:hypothetical protein
VENLSAVCFADLESFCFLFCREISVSVSLELRSGGYRETNQSRNRRWGERIFLEVYMCVARSVRYLHIHQDPETELGGSRRRRGERARARNCEGGDDDDVDPFEHHNSSEDCKLCRPREWAEECAAAAEQAASSVGFELEKQEQQNGDEEKELTTAAAETIAKEVQRI